MAIVAFRSIGLILAAVANSMQESQILIQLIYLPMLFLSGATFPASMFPWWLKEITQFLPATHLVTGIQGMLLSNQSLREGPNATAAFAMVLTTLVGLFIAYKLFRWEKEEKIKASSKLWLLAIMLPFLVLGAINVRTHQNITQQRIQARQLARGETFLIRGARIFVGDGRVIEQGAVLVRSGKIAAVYDGAGSEVGQCGSRGSGGKDDPARPDRCPCAPRRAGRFRGLEELRCGAGYGTRAGGLPLQRRDGSTQHG
jgi:hypothetical protein